ncbi:MAG: NAD(P)/FAD-dependent oxidoreductase, partial [Nitrososphaerales archaeon]
MFDAITVIGTYATKTEEQSSQKTIKKSDIRMSEITKYLIIGGGLSSGFAVDGIRELDVDGKITLVTKEHHIPYNRVVLSKGYLRGEIARDELFFKKEEFYRNNKVDLIQGREVTSLNTKNNMIELDDHQKFTYSRLLLATGGRARKLSIPGSELRGTYYLRTIEDSDALQEIASSSQRAVIIGGGFIGCEVAASLASKGLEVTILERAKHLLSAVIDDGTGEWIDSYFRNKGVRVITSCSVSRIIGENGRVVAIEIEDGKKVDTDFVLIGVGLVPNEELAESAGLKVEKHIVVNEFMETSVEGVYAAGDVTRFYCPLFYRYLHVEHYDVAVKQGQIAGTNMAGGRKAFDEVPFFFSEAFDLAINAYGDLAHRTKIVKRGARELQNGFLEFYL